MKLPQGVWDPRYSRGSAGFNKKRVNNSWKSGEEARAVALFGGQGMRAIRMHLGVCFYETPFGTGLPGCDHYHSKRRKLKSPHSCMIWSY